MSSATCVCGWLVRCSFIVKKNLLRGEGEKKKPLALALRKKKKLFFGSLAVTGQNQNVAHFVLFFVYSS